MNFANYRQLLLLSYGIFVSPFIALAAPFTQKEAMQAVSDKLSPKAKVVHTEQQDGRALYHVINRGNHNGFCIVGNTPEGETRLLGYTDSGDFDLNDAPDGLRLLLDAFTQRMSQQASTSATSTMNPALRIARQDVAPMLTTRWHQNSPYNDMIPDKCLTGCVATAFAQIIKYYQYPDTYPSRRTPSTYYQGKKCETKLIQYFDWSNMKDSYVGGDATDTEKTAVATLMQYLSYDIGSYFTPSGTSATVGKAASILKSSWTYDQAICDWSKTLFEADLWEEMIYTEIHNKRPVVMGGQNAKSGAGHAFVIDGYDNTNKLYHINWGWGNGNGYYDLDLTNTSDFTAFSERQVAAVGIQPKSDQNKMVIAGIGGEHTVRSYHKKSDEAYILYKFKWINGSSNDNSIGLEIKDLNTGEYRTVKAGYYQSGSYFQLMHRIKFDTIPEGARWRINMIHWNNSDPQHYTYVPNEENMRNIQFEVLSAADGPTEITEYFDHRPVVESYISGACMWSYNSDLILDSLQRQCGDQAIIINTHNNLDAVGMPKNYWGLPFPGTPTTMIDRQNCEKTSTGLFSQIKRVNTKAPAKVQISDVKREAGTYDIIVKTRSRFGFSAAKSDYRIAYVIIEDSIPNCAQRNYASGSSNTYFGDVQNLPNPYTITFHHCARAIYPKLDGDTESFPTQIQKSTDYDNEFRITIDPNTITDITNLRLATLLIDACAGTVLNGDIVKLTQFDQSDRDQEITVKEPGTLWNQLWDKWQYVKKLKVSGPINGEDMNVIRIMCGMKDYTNVLPEGIGSLSDLDLEDAQLVAGGLIYDYYGIKYYQQNDILVPYTFYKLNQTTDLRSFKLPKGVKRIGKNALYNLKRIGELYIPDHVEGLIGLPSDQAVKLTISPKNKNYVRQGPDIYTAAYDTLIMHEASKGKVVFDLRCNFIDCNNCDFTEADTLVFPCATTIDGSTVKEKCAFIYYGKNAECISDLVSFTDSLEYLLIESSKTPYGSSSISKMVKKGAAPKAMLSYYTSNSPWKKLTWSAIEDLDITWDERGVLIEADKLTAYINQPHQMRYAISMTKLLSKSVQWTSSNKSVATIDADGNLTPIATGKTTITVKVKNTSYSAKCVVTVKEDPTNAITEVSETTAPDAIYSLDGKPLSAPARGINIIREGGKTRKVIVL